MVQTVRGIPQQEWPLVLLSYLFFMQDYFYQTLLLQYWSLGVEMKFYAVAPALILFLEKLQLNSRHAVVSLIIVLLLMLRVVVAWVGPPATSETSFSMFRSPFHMSLDSLIIGVAAFFLWQDPRIRRLIDTPLISNAVFAAGTLSFVAVCSFTPPYFYDFPQSVSFFSETLFFTLVSLSFAAMLLGLLGPCILSRTFGSWPARIVAELSYSLYLVHILFARHALAFAHKHIPDPANMTILWCSSFICLLIYAVPVASIIYICIERPINRRARKTEP
jgi:peptidoglycan/LPS O-acetylase OafA/YrhL